MEGLNEKQARFCQEYIIDLNARQAAIRAGYSEKTAQVQGSRLLSDAKVSNYIASLLKERSKETKIDANWVLNQAAEVHHRCMQAEKVTYRNGDPVVDPDGNPIWKFDSAGALRALEIVGKHVDVRAFEQTSTADEEAQPLNITINTVDASKHRE